MKKMAILFLACGLATASCSRGADTGDQSSTAAAGGGAAQTPSSGRGGTISIGEQTWTFVPSIQCSVYPNNQVNIAGHAAADSSLEITIDYYPDGDGPVSVTMGTDGREGSWFSIQDTLKWQIEGRHVSGTATFSEYRGGMGKTADGSFDIRC